MNEPSEKPDESVDAVSPVETTEQTPTEQPAPKRRGRPPGSKNKPKDFQPSETPTEGETVAEPPKKRAKKSADIDLPQLSPRRVTLAEAVTSASEVEKQIADKLCEFYRAELPEFPPFGLAIVRACALHALVNLVRDADPNPYVSATVAAAPALLVVKKRRDAAVSD